jgi:hypothetical protein
MAVGQECIYSVEKLRFWQERKNFSLSEKFYPFRYEGPYETPGPPSTSLTPAYA